VATALSLLAIAISVVTWFATDRKVAGIEVERRREEVDARLRADVTVGFERRQEQGRIARANHFVVLRNRGPAVARNVSVSFDTDDAPVTRPELDRLPLALLDVGQEFPLLAAITHGMPSQVNVTVVWTDGSGEQTKTLPISLI
jgi:hypothetical protein